MMRRFLIRLRNIALYFLAFLGALFILFIIFVPKTPLKNSAASKEIVLVPTYTPAPASAPAVVATVAPTSAPKSTDSPTPTSSPTSAPTVAPMIGVTMDVANLRAGPGTTYPISGSLASGQSVIIVAKNDAGDWYQLDSKAWVASFLVDTREPPTVVPTAISLPVMVAYLRNDRIGKVYLTDLSDIYNAIQESFGLIGTRFSQYVDNPSIIHTKTWQNDVTASLTVLKASLALIPQMNPPFYLADLHSDLLQATDHLNKAIELVNRGLRNESDNDFNLGAQEIKLATPFLISIRTRLDNINSEINK